MLKEVKSSGVRKDSGTYFDFSSFFSLTLTFPFTTFLQLSNKVKAKKKTSHHLDKSTVLQKH